MTAYYDYSILTEKKILNEKDYILAWSQICEGLGKGGKDYGTVSMHPRKNAKEKWFNASADQNHVLIQKARDLTKNSNITMHYWIRPMEFEIIAERYNRYVRGISNDIRYTDSHMSSYIITLIAELLQ